MTILRTAKTYFPSARKDLGQHFLTNGAVKDRILTACSLWSEDVVLEIGPGRGALTAGIAAAVKHLHAVEADRRLAELLKSQPPARNLTVWPADFLKFDLSQIPDVTKIIGNLPYNVASPIIEKILISPHPARLIFFTVQLEFAQRLTALPGNKSYGSLTCFVQYHADAEILFKIPGAAFSPKPKVTSALVRLVKRPPPVQVDDEKKLFQVIRAAFSRRRKKIHNSLSSLGERAMVIEALRRAGIHADARAEDLSLQDFSRIDRAIHSR